MSIKFEFVQLNKNCEVMLDLIKFHNFECDSKWNCKLGTQV